MSAALLAAVAAETTALETFIALLEEEQKLLISGDADAVLPLLDRKVALINDLTQAGQARDGILQAQGVANNRESLDDVFKALGDVAYQDWQQLLALARTANQLNQTNGQLINSRLQHNQQALAILMSATGTLDDATYGPDGHQRHGGGSRPLGSA